MSKQKRKPQSSTAAGKGNWRKVFLESLAVCPNVSVACDKAHVSRALVYLNRERSATFRAQWDTAVRHGVEMLEAFAWKAATVGLPKTQWVKHKGQWIKLECDPEFYPAMAIFLLKNHAPDKYCREYTRHEVTGKDAGPIKVETAIEKLPDAELDRIINEGLARGLSEAAAVGAVKARVNGNGVAHNGNGSK